MGKVVSVNNEGKKILVEVEDEIARIINNEDCKFRKKAQYHGMCVCPAIDNWKCIGDCPTCKYFREGKMRHYDEIPTDSDTDLWNTLIDTDKVPEEMVVNMELFKEILAEIKETAPDIYELGVLLEAGESITRAAELLGINRTTLNSRRERLIQNIYSRYGNFFRQF